MILCSVKEEKVSGASKGHAVLFCFFLAIIPGLRYNKTKLQRRGRQRDFTGTLCQRARAYDDRQRT